MTDVVEAMARAMWEAFCAAQTCPKNCPSWGELQAQGHQGRHRINEFLGYAAAAIRACRDAGGLVVGKMPEPLDYIDPDEEDAAYADGHNAALAAVRAAAVSGEEV